MSGRSNIHVPRRFVADEWGGTETVVLEICKQQRASGMDPRIVTSMALAERNHDDIGGIPVDRYAHTYPFFGLSAADRAAMDKKGGNLLSLSLLRALIKQPDVRIYHAHAKDTEFVAAGQNRYGLYGAQLAQTAPREWWRYRLPGYGVVDWRRYLDALYQVGYNGVLSVEHEDPEWSATPEQAVRGPKLATNFLARMLVKWRAGASWNKQKKGPDSSSNPAPFFMQRKYLGQQVKLGALASN